MRFARAENGCLRCLGVIVKDGGGLALFIDVCGSSAVRWPAIPSKVAAHLPAGCTQLLPDGSGVDSVMRASCVTVEILKSSCYQWRLLVDDLLSAVFGIALVLVLTALKPWGRLTTVGIMKVGGAQTDARVFVDLGSWVLGAKQ